jgi:PadR family transcriptional regulator, regulatory protein AphA
VVGREKIMTIEYAILGFLSWRPLSGYDLKKLFADSGTFYWSGNNNQIYRTLVQVHREGLVSLEVQRQESYPDRKVYSLTDKGRAQLRDWVLSAPEPPQLRKSFLIQLAWADQLGPTELDAMLERYAGEVHVQLLMYREQARRRSIDPARTPRESYLWKMIFENWITSYENELEWVRRLRKELGERPYPVS